MIDQPRCEYCGKFISDDAYWKHTKDGDTSEINSRMIYIMYPTPEPYGDVFWHTKCESRTKEK